MKYTYLLFAFAFFSLASACTFAELLEVQVFDQQNKPIEGAQIIINYQKNTNLTVDGRIVGTTDESGIFRAQLCNVVTLDKADPFYTIDVKTPTKSETRRTQYGENTHVIPGVHYEAFVLPTTYQKIIAIVKDASDNVYSNVQVSLTSPYQITRRSDNNGAASFSVESFTSFTLVAYYSGMNVTKTFNSENETKTVYLTLPIFKTYVIVSVIDETNSPVENATVILSDGITRVNKTNFKGQTSFYEINSSSIQLSIEFQDVRFEKKYNLLESRVINVPFTRNPINFLSYNTTINKTNQSCSINIYANVSNTRESFTSLYANLNYSFDNSAWSTAKMENITNISDTTLFFYSLQCPPNDSFNLYYSLKANDMYSVRETGIDRIALKPNQVTVTVSTNNTTNSSAAVTANDNAKKNEIKPAETIIDYLVTIFSLLIVALGAITLVLIILHVFKEQKKS